MGAHLQDRTDNAHGAARPADSATWSEQETATHRAFMDQALALARKASGRTSPNPVVGAVLVRDGVVVGEGYHRKAGSDHAEIDAIRQAGDAAEGAALYVTLEPCNHVGRTGPCAEAIIAAGITHVFFATSDPANHGSERGRDRLVRAGLTVREGLCAADARFDNRFFLHASKYARPWVVAKYASSLDGRIATVSGESQWITGEESRRRAHQLRALVDAVMVGSGTVLADDPELTVRLTDYAHPQPARIVLDSRGRIPLSAKLLSGCQGIRTIIATTSISASVWREDIRWEGAEILLVPADESGSLQIPQLLAELNLSGVQSVMVEGGATVLGSFFDAGLVDEVWAFLAPLVLGGLRAPGAIAGSGASTLDKAFRLEDIQTECLGPDLLIRGLVQKKEVPVLCLQES